MRPIPRQWTAYFHIHIAVTELRKREISKLNVEDTVERVKYARYSTTTNRRTNKTALGHMVHCLGHGFKSGLPIGSFLSEMSILF